MENNWTYKYLLNIEEIDKQHRTFFELWDKECPLTDNKNLEILLKIVEKLEDYIKIHFLYEENLLEKLKYDELENHKAEHNFFVQKVDEMKQEIKYSNPLTFKKIADFMKKWFLSHIIVSDKKYQETVLNK